jgi:cytochrome c oxidase subunit 1
VTDSREVARRWTLRYLAASTPILFVAGLFGELIRSSQAGFGRVDPNTWYALMTAHGLGAFLGWAGFAVMGLSWWVLEEVGFPLRRFGAAMAALTWWLMVLGVLGVVVSTLALHFAGSWVFLYPLPFHGAGRWGDTATFVFSLSVLLVGLAIVTWCVGILHTTVSPALHAVSTRWRNRFGVALGLGYLWPKRFATNPRPVPYPVIPLTVIAIDMVVATLPLAALLVEMMIQAYRPGVHVDPLLAKNVLWWFGHPVVYLLLFPAVAVYYLLVPRLAGRQLVAGNVIAVAWGIAVIANVLVWAHHVYLDYPANSVQGDINTAMQPMTFALVIPSALSLYSLGFTIFRSNYRSNAVGWALFLGMISWFVAGLSGIVNATIAADVDVHNTLWIVGHFHEMALINIGFVIFAALYQWLPELTGKTLWSEALAKWHIWLTFVFATVHSFVWQWQGLEGAPRRWAVLPHQFESLNRPGVVLAWGIGASQLLLAWNLVQTLRGAERRQADRPYEVVAAIAMVVALGLMAAAGAAGYFIGRGARTSAPATTTATTASATAAGKQVFATAGCSACHTLAAAGSHGTVGPNLDQKKPSQALVVDRVTHGKGAMPSFSGRLTAQQIQQVAAFVSSSAGR